MIEEEKGENNCCFGTMAAKAHAHTLLEKNHFKWIYKFSTKGDIKISNKQKAKDINPDEWLDKI